MSSQKTYNASKLIKMVVDKLCVSLISLNWYIIEINIFNDILIGRLDIISK